MENPFEQLGERLNNIESFLRTIDERLNTPPILPSSERYIDTKEVSGIFNVSDVSVWDWEKKGLLKAYRIGRLKRFKLNEVLSSPKAIERGIVENSKNHRVL